MMSSRNSRAIRLLDNRGSESLEIEAFVRRHCETKLLDLAEESWEHGRSLLIGEGKRLGLDPIEHAHWDWRNKSDRVQSGKFELTVIECEADLQGLMVVESKPRRSRFGVGSIVYIDYIESAPWNLRGFADSPRFIGVGTQLIADAVVKSIEQDHGGRVGLHSLPQAEAFYSKLGMTRWGRDQDYFDLTYFECEVSSPFVQRVLGEMI